MCNIFQNRIEKNTQILNDLNKFLKNIIYVKEKRKNISIISQISTLINDWIWNLKISLIKFKIEYISETIDYDQRKEL